MVAAIDIGLDGHVHTRRCLHATGEMEEYIQTAIARGLTCLTFLEHLEIGIDYQHRTWLTEQDFDDYFTEGERLKDKYGRHIRIRLGIEAGYNPAETEALRRRLGQYPCEIVGLSYHYFRHDDRHLNLVSRNPSNIQGLGALGVERIAEHYYSTLFKAVQTIEANVLCHLDAVLRHHPEMVLTPAHIRQIDAILGVMAEKGMALEINTSGFVYRDMPYPELRIIALALSKGISLQAGSDAHAPEQVGRFFDRLPELILEAQRRVSY